MGSYHYYMKLGFIAILMLGLAGPAYAAKVDRVLDAIRQVETGGKGNIRGDNGEARGPYQIHRQYWIDSGVPGRWQDCDREAYARRVVLAYWRRHCPTAVRLGQAEVLARIHNGGPRGAQIASTAGYWQRVRKAMG